MIGTSYLLGSSYYPEQWRSDRLNEDFRKMAELGFNCVRMGEFAWSTFEPSDGAFAFQWLDHAIELAASHGIASILGTPTASVPPWLRKAHPDVLGGNEQGPFDYGARKGYCVNCDAFLAAADRVVSAVAQHYSANPHVIGWQIDNEPGYPFVCYDPNCLAAFRLWLYREYGDISNLNQVWGTAFWSHGYNHWNEIEMPLNVGDGGWNPGQKLDYRRFYSDSFLSYLTRQAKIIRAHIPSGQFVCTNWPNTHWSVDLFEAAESIPLDATSWDNYSAIPGITDYRKQFGAAFHHDLSRCAGPNQQFLISEQTASMPSTAPQEGVALQTWQDIAHGSYGTIFFEWRPPVAGAEQGYKSVLQLDGTFNKSEPQLRQLGANLATLSKDIHGATTESDIALMYSYPNQWFSGFWCGEAGYDSHLQRWYAGLKALKRNIDIVPPGRSLDRYRLVAAPRLEILGDADVAELIRYVRAGGILVLDCGFGCRDEFNRLRELAPLGALAEAAGLRIVNSASQNAMAGNLIQGGANQMAEFDRAGVRFGDQTHRFEPWRILEEVELCGAEPIATFVGGLMDRKPAVTVNKAGLGHVVYTALDSKDALFYEALAAAIRQRFSIQPVFGGVPVGVDVVSRVTDQAEYVFLLNLTTVAEKIAVPGEAVALIGEIEDGCILLPALGCAVLKRARE